MGPREKEVIRAAHVLKDYCGERKNCVNCALGNGACPTTPAFWKLPELEEAEKRKETAVWCATANNPKLLEALMNDWWSVAPASRRMVACQIGETSRERLYVFITYTDEEEQSLD